MTLLALAQASEADEGFESPLDLLFREVETGCRCAIDKTAEGLGGRDFSGGRASVRWVRVAEPLTPERDLSLSRYRAFKAAAGKTLKSIIISCNARLTALASAELREVLSSDDMRATRAAQADAFAADPEPDDRREASEDALDRTARKAGRAVREHRGRNAAEGHLVHGAGTGKAASPATTCSSSPRPRGAWSSRRRPPTTR